MSQEPSNGAKPSSSSSSSSSETVAKPLTKKQIAKKQKELEKELAGPWKKWMNEDVLYIITDEEKQGFKRLKTDEERQQFVEHSGCAAILHPIPKRTSIRKSTTGALLTPTIITLLASPAGKLIAA